MMKKISREYFNAYQLKMPLEISKIIEFSDSVYTFSEVLNHVDLKKYLVRERHGRTGCPEYDSEKPRRVILFAFMVNGYVSVRQIKAVQNGYSLPMLLDENSAPSFMTIDNFMKNKLSVAIEDIFAEINKYIFAETDVDLEHVYIDGAKITANSNKYSWVWKKSSVKNRQKTFDKVALLFEEMNNIILPHGVKFGLRNEYAIEYLEQIQSQFLSLIGFDPKMAAVNCAVLP